jgi:hypothetical protein
MGLGDDSITTTSKALGPLSVRQPAEGFGGYGPLPAVSRKYILKRST